MDQLFPLIEDSKVENVTYKRLLTLSEHCDVITKQVERLQADIRKWTVIYFKDKEIREKK